MCMWCRDLFISVSPTRTVPPSLCLCRSSLPSVFSHSGCHICRLFPLEFISWTFRLSLQGGGVIEELVLSQFGDRCGAGVRGRGKAEYKYVSGDTSEHGGEVESEQIVLPLNNRVKEKTVFFFSEYGFLRPSCIELQRIYQNWSKVNSSQKAFLSAKELQWWERTWELQEGKTRKSK